MIFKMTPERTPNNKKMWTGQAGKLMNPDQMASANVFFQSENI